MPIAYFLKILKSSTTETHMANFNQSSLKASVEEGDPVYINEGVTSFLMCRVNWMQVLAFETHVYRAIFNWYCNNLYIHVII